MTSNEVVKDLENLSRQLQRVHKIFLDNEKLNLDIKIGMRLAPLDFFNRLTQDPEMAWMKPFTSLIAEIDEFTDETKKPRRHADGTVDPLQIATLEDLKKFRARVEFVLLNPASKVADQYKLHLAQDPDLVIAHADLRAALGPPPTND